jgi:hypothetical protein
MRRNPWSACCSSSNRAKREDRLEGKGTDRGANLEVEGCGHSKTVILRTTKVKGVSSNSHKT